MYVQSCVHPIFVTVSSCVEPMMANVTSRPQSPLAIFSPALRLMCVEARTFTVICSAAFLLPFALCCAAAPHSSWCCRAQCGATGELRDMLLRCLRGIDLVETWRNSFKNLRKIIHNGLQDIYRFARPVRASQGRDAPALRALFVAVQALRDSVVLLDPFGEQQYMSHNLNQCLDRMSVPSQGPVGDIAPVLESFDAFVLASESMLQFGLSERECFDWICSYRALPLHGAAPHLHEFYPLYLDESTAGLMSIRSVLAAYRDDVLNTNHLTNIRYCFAAFGSLILAVRAASFAAPYSSHTRPDTKCIQ